MNKLIFKNSVIIIGGRLVPPVLSFILVPILLRHLGKDLFGLWVILNTISIAGLFGFFDFNLPASIVKLASADLARKDFRQLNMVFSTSFLIFSAIGGIIAGALLILSRPLFIHVFKIPPELIPVALQVVGLFSLQTFFEFFTQPFIAMIQARQRYDIQQFLNIGCTIAAYVTMIVLLQFNFGIFALAVVSFIKTAVVLMGYSIAASKMMPELSFRSQYIAIPTIKRLLSLSCVLMGFRLVGIASKQANKIIIAIFKKISMVGDLSILERVYTIPEMFGSFVSAAIMPAASSAHAVENWEALNDMFIYGTKYTVFVATSVALCSMVLIRPFLILWLGPEYSNLATLGQLMLVTIFFDALISSGQNMVVGIGKPLSILWLNMLSMALTMVVTIILVPQLGLAGVVYGMIAGSILGGCSQFFVISLLMRVPVRFAIQHAVMICFPAIFSVVLCAYSVSRVISPHTFLNLGIIVLCAAFIGCLVFSVTALDQRERKFIYGIFQKKVAL